MALAQQRWRARYPPCLDLRYSRIPTPGNKVSGPDLPWEHHGISEAFWHASNVMLLGSLMLQGSNASKKRYSRTGVMHCTETTSCAENSHQVV